MKVIRVKSYPWERRFQEFCVAEDKSLENAWALANCLDQIYDPTLDLVHHRVVSDDYETRSYAPAFPRESRGWIKNS